MNGECIDKTRQLKKNVGQSINLGFNITLLSHIAFEEEDLEWKHNNSKFFVVNPILFLKLNDPHLKLIYLFF